MLSFRIFVVAICAFLMSFLSQTAFAGDNGVIKLDVADAVAVGMGGAFTAEADRPSAVYYNPAGITQMVGPAVSAGITFLQPQIEYKSPTGNTSEMNRDDYIFPNVFVTSPVIKDKLYIGLGESTNFGSGNDWAANSFSRYNTVKDSIADKDYMLVGAYKITDQWSLGAGATNDDSTFEHDAAINQSLASAPDADALFKAHDDAWGFNLATMFKLNAQNQFGLDYKSPIHHTYDGTLYLNNLSPLGLGSAGYFGSSSFATKAIQKLTLPQSVTLGYSFKPTNKWTFNFDLGWTDWSQYKQQTTVYPYIPSGGTQAGILALANPQPRDWTSVWSESLGVQYAVTNNFRLRTGYEHHQTPVPESTFDTEFPDSDSNSYTFGFGYDFTKNLTLDVAYVADFYQSRDVVNGTNALGVNLSGKYREFVNVGTATLTYKF